MRSKFIITPREAEFILRREGESWEARFKKLRDAIQHASDTPNAKGATLLILNADGTAKLEFKI